MDAFFAAVEQRDNPELRGKPIAVGFDGPRGVVSTASYEARLFGVHSAQSIAQAKRLCPDLNIVPCRHEHYKEVSQQIHHIFQDYTDLIEPISIDEAFLDVTHNKKGIELAVDVAREIKARIKAETGLTASAGISYCKFLAKVASDYRKPDILPLSKLQLKQVEYSSAHPLRLIGLSVSNATSEEAKKEDRENSTHKPEYKELELEFEEWDE